MNVHEFHIDRLKKQIKRIEENPDPRRMKSNKMLYELMIENHKAQLQADRDGRPQSSSGPGISALWLSMGIVGGGDGSKDATHATYLNEYMNKARERGFPVDNACEMSMTGLARWAAGAGEQSVQGTLCRFGCPGFMLADTVLHHMQPRPTYFLDRGFEETEDNLKHVVEQLHEYIEFTEKLYPKFVKYDEDKLAGLQSYIEQAEMYQREIYYLQRNRPAPLAGKEAFMETGPLPVGMHPDPKKGVAYARIRRDEVADRVANGIGGISNEKLRFIWTTSTPWFMDPFRTLEKRGVALILFYAAGAQRFPFPPRKRFWGDRQLTPLEKVAVDGPLNSLLGGSGTKWTGNLLAIAKDLQIDGIINYNLVGCTGVLGLKKILEERAEKELGIPVLQLEGKEFSSSLLNEADVNRQLNEFVDLCLSKKGLN